MINDEGKNPHAVALAGLGAAKGGMARAEKLSPERRKEIAATAAAARWRSAPIKATHAGVLRIGEVALDCANLPDGRRVISEAAIMRALGRGYSGYYSQRDAAAGEGSAVLPRYVAPLALKPFITNELLSLLSQPIAYLPPEGKTLYKGIEAQALPKICRVWLEARNAGRLPNKAQKRTAEKAEILSFGFAEVGIAALIDEATGAQDDRAKNALAKILEDFIAKELRPYVRTFPTDFYKEMFRLRKWKWPDLPADQRKRPVLVGKLTDNVVYDRLAPGVKQRLKDLIGRNESGRLKHKMFQRLTEQIGDPKLREHLASVVALMKAADDWPQFMTMINRSLKRYKPLPLFDEQPDSQP